MFKDSLAFSGFSVNDLIAAQVFYSEKLGLEVENNGMGLQVSTKGNNPIFIYQKPDHAPATYTVLNFPVDDIDAAVDELTNNDVAMIRYEHNGGGMPDQDDKGILRGRSAGMGPDIAWFNDPAGNILAVLQN